MAVADSIVMSKPGYGKRHAPDQRPRTAKDFAHLDPSAAAVAAYIDRLPEGAAIDHKTLAKKLAGFGQVAVRHALDALTEAGHLRRVKEHLITDGGARWVTRTYFSRTARSADWWAKFADDVRPDADADQDAPEPVPARSAAYRTLANLGSADPRMTLSAAECEALETQAAEWLARGASRDHLVRALTTGLPTQVHNAGAMARRRLEDKMPPKPVREPEIVIQRVMVCLHCERSDDSVLHTGVCEVCHAEEDIPDTFRARPAAEVAQRADALRIAAGLKPRSIG